MLFRRTSLASQQLNAFGYATWKSYADLRKKAVEQEFTWGGFVLSLSIAFLFVFSGASGFNALYENTLNKNIDVKESAKTLLLEKVPDNSLASSFIC